MRMFGSLPVCQLLASAAILISVGCSPPHSGTAPPNFEDPDVAQPVTPEAPALAEPGPSEPAPSEPAPSEPAPSEPAPSEPAPSEPAPSEPAPSEPAPSEPAPRLGETATGLLEAHNQLRAQHCAPAMKWSDSVAAAAQAWAD